MAQPPLAGPTILARENVAAEKPIHFPLSSDVVNADTNTGDDVVTNDSPTDHIVV